MTGKQVQTRGVRLVRRKTCEAPPLLWGLGRARLAAPDTTPPHRPSPAATVQSFQGTRGRQPLTSPHSHPTRLASAPRSPLVRPPSPEKRVNRGRFPRGLLRDPTSRDLCQSEETRKARRRNLTVALPGRNPGNGNGSYRRCPSPPQRLPQRH